MEKKKILFICTHNSARSQMAEGIVNALWGKRFQAFSAGTEPSRVNPLAVEVMKEIGIDISQHRSKGIGEFNDQSFEYVITVCDRTNETCPFFPGGGVRLHKGFPDPASVVGSEERKREAFRAVRDQIKEWIETEFMYGLHKTP